MIFINEFFDVEGCFSISDLIFLLVLIVSKWERTLQDIVELMFFKPNLSL